MLAAIEAAISAVARNSGMRLPQRSHSQPNRPDPMKAPMNISCDEQQTYKKPLVEQVASSQGTMKINNSSY
jgi:hypothetical protein